MRLPAYNRMVMGCRQAQTTQYPEAAGAGEGEQG